MTTRGQKRSNDATTSQASESGTILNMLTSNQLGKSTEEGHQTDPANAKDVEITRVEGPAIAKDQVETTTISTDPALAKDTG